jgi:hypothetical protein
MYRKSVMVGIPIKVLCFFIHLTLFSSNRGVKKNTSDYSYNNTPEWPSDKIYPCEHSSDLKLGYLLQNHGEEDLSNAWLGSSPMKLSKECLSHRVIALPSVERTEEIRSDQACQEDAWIERIYIKLLGYYFKVSN